MYQPNMREEVMILEALRFLAREARKEAAGRRLYGAQHAYVRSQLRNRSKELDALADRIQGR